MSGTLCRIGRRHWGTATFVLGALLLVGTLSAGAAGEPAPIARWETARAGQSEGGETILDIARVSVNSDGAQADGDSDAPVLSADGRIVAFESYATDLVAQDYNEVGDVFIHDREDGHMFRVIHPEGGIEGNGQSYSPSLSGDGHYVAFASLASNFAPDDENDAADIFVFDPLNWDSWTLVSVDSAGNQANGGSGAPALSFNGKLVAYQSAADNLVPGDTNGQVDIFVHDLTTRQTTRVSVSSNGVQANMAVYNPVLSADGRYVAFDSSADNLVANDNNDTRDVFVHDRQSGQTMRVSVNSAGVEGNDYSDYAALSANGRLVVFRSTASNLVDDDNNSSDDVFVHDRLTGQTTRVSISSSGNEANSGTYAYGPPAISADGRYVTFDSEATNLVANDDNDTYDVFRHDRQTGRTSLVSMNPSGVAGNAWSGLSSLSTDGQYVAYSSAASNLIDGDSNNAGDIFVMEYIAPVALGDPEPVLSVGVNHTCALRPNGNVDCWGWNAEGQATDQTGHFVQVSAGGYHTCALRLDGEVACWGTNEYGQSSPPTGPFTQVSAGWFHNCALRPDGSVACWGASIDSNIEDQQIPYSQISAGDQGVCGMTEAGRVMCWHTAYDGAEAYAAINAGGDHVCGLRAEGTINCWGKNDHGQAEEPDGLFTQVTLGSAHTCALKTDGKALCWGYGEDGQTTPLPGPFVQLSATWNTTCGLRPDGRVACWGRNEFGQAEGQEGPYGPFDLAANNPPLAAAQNVTTLLDTAIAINLAASDADGHTLTFSIVDPPQHGALEGLAPKLDYIPATGYSGPDSFTFKANDNLVDSNIATVSITVTTLSEVYLPVMRGWRME